MTNNANDPKHWDYGGYWVFCPFCGHFDCEDTPECCGPNEDYCEVCKRIIRPEDREGTVVDGVLVLRYGLQLLSSQHPIRLEHEPYLPHNLNIYADFPIGMTVMYRRYPDEVMTGEVVEPGKSAIRQHASLEHGESCCVSFNNWIEPRARGAAARGSHAMHIIHKSGLFVPRIGAQVELF